MNIPVNNSYLFGLPGKGGYNYLIVTNLLRKYANLCGAQKSHTVRGTELRKI